jgi:hypothetical protein
MWGVLHALFFSFLFGGALHLLYDAIRILRILCGVRYGGFVALRLRSVRFPLLPPDLASRPPRKAGLYWQRALVLVTDLLFCLAAAFLFSILLYWQNDGQFRAVFLLFAALGYFAFHKTVGRLILAAGETVALLLRVLLAYLCLFVRVPLVWLFRIGRKAGAWLFAQLRGVACLLYVRLYLPHYSRREETRRLREAYRKISKTSCKDRKDVL